MGKMISRYGRPTQDSGVSPESYRDFMSMFPTGVGVVTAFDGHGTPHGLTCTSLASVTLRPPTLLVCLNCGSGTLAAVRQSGAFAVNLLPDEGQAMAELFASPESHRFQYAAWRISPVSLTPVLTSALAVAECRVSQMFAVGDHYVVFGEVLETSQARGNVPLLYGARQFASWPPNGVLHGTTTTEDASGG